MICMLSQHYFSMSWYVTKSFLYDMHGPLLQWSANAPCFCLRDHTFSTSLVMEKEQKNKTIEIKKKKIKTPNDQVMSETDFKFLFI